MHNSTDRGAVVSPDNSKDDTRQKDRKHFIPFVLEGMQSGKEKEEEEEKERTEIESLLKGSGQTLSSGFIAHSRIHFESIITVSCCYSFRLILHSSYFRNIQYNPIYHPHKSPVLCIPEYLYTTEEEEQASFI